MISLNRKRYTFTPKLIPTVIVLILFAILCSLGVWQLKREQEKQQLLDSLQLNQQKLSLSLDQITEPVEKFRYYSIELRGQFMDKPILLDNKTNQGRVGYQVVMPLKVADHKKLVLVNLGWIALGQSRAQLPKIQAITGVRDVMGTVYVPLKTPYKLNDKAQTLAGWPKRIQTLDFDQISQLLKQPVYPFVVWLSPEAKFGYHRKWRVVNMSPQKHRGYAVQWFSLAAALLVLFIVVSMKRIDINGSN